MRLAAETVTPFRMTSPVSGTSSPAMILSNVVFPHPLGPRTTAVFPEATSIDTLSSARCDPNRFVISASVIALELTGPFAAMRLRLRRPQVPR